MGFHCFFCDREYSHRQGRHRHVKKAHPFELAVEGYERWNKKFCCMEDGCSQRAFTTIADLREHLTECHQFTFTEEYKVLASEAEFQKWKEDFQKETYSNFIQHGGVHVRAKAQCVRYYYCNLSGNYESKSLGIRSKMTKKLGFYCTATMVVINELDGTISVTYCNQHYRHQCVQKVTRRERRILAQSVKNEPR